VYSGGEFDLAPVAEPEPPFLVPSAMARPVVAVQVSPQPIQSVQVVIPAARKGNPLAIASLVLGIFAALICWIPLLGLLSWPLAGLAILLGLVALVLAVATSRPGLSAAGVGTALGVVAIVV